MKKNQKIKETMLQKVKQIVDAAPFLSTENCLLIFKKILEANLIPALWAMYRTFIRRCSLKR